MRRVQCIERICRLPLEFRKSNESFSTLVGESQFHVFCGYITQADVDDYLKKHFSLVAEWEKFSNDKRTPEGWYISINGGKNTVGKLTVNSSKPAEIQFQTPTEACAYYILKELQEIIVSSLHINKVHEFDTLLEISAEIGNSLAGKKISDDIDRMKLAEGVGNKIIQHSLTIKHLLGGYLLSLPHSTLGPLIDFSSVFVLTRSALETYLTFNYVFVANNDSNLREFRFLLWDLAGYTERNKFSARTTEHIDRKEDERTQIEHLRIQIQNHSIFASLKVSEQKQAINGEWRLNYAWHNLAVEAGFNYDFFKTVYKYLCSYAHTGRLSIIQIQQNKSIAEQQFMSDLAVDTMLIVLAKYMHDYIRVVPALNDWQNDSEKYPIIAFWKTMGDQIVMPGS